MTRLYDATHKQWNHTGHITPEVEISESQYPFAELKPAAWLPVQRYDTKTEDWAVLAAGKVVAVDREGRGVPAGLKFAFEAAAGTNVLTYTANDYETGTTDLTTGVAYATNGTTNYTQTQVTTALRNRGLILAAETARDFISWPVGYAPYTYWQWCGGDGWDPSEYRRHNYNTQHQTAIGTDKVLQIPLVPAQQAAETMGDGTISGAAITFGTSQWHNATGLHATTRYASLVAAADNVVGYVFGRTPVAKITTNTPITDSGSTLASWSEVGSIADVMALGSGYFYIDYDAGVMFVYESGGNAVPAGFTDGVSTITYYQYETAAAGSTSYAQVIGDVKVGDFLTFDDNSNYVKFTSDILAAFGGAGGDAFSADPDYDTAADADISAQLEAAITQARLGVIGQVIAVLAYPRSGLEKVMTQYQNLTATEKMPGTATAGMTDALNLSGGANRVAIINFCQR
jgi:hypothetical protein